MLGGAGAAALVAQRPDAFQASYDHPSIGYLTRPVNDRISQLNRDIERGEVSLAFDGTSGYLRSLLAALDVPSESQVLVFSQTSSQARLVNPRNPRAIFFHDTVSIGWVRGGSLLELAAADPRQGVIFYTLEQKPAEKPLLRRDNRCLLCHLSWDTLAVPGLLVISTFPMSDDKNAYASGVVADHRTSFDQRWGGWYVPGNALPRRHLGNVPVIRPAAELAKPAAPPPQLRSIEGQFNIDDGYPTRYSDVAAVMVLEHQTHATNLLTRLGWEARLVEYGTQTGAAPRGGSAGSEASADRVRDAARDLVDYLLFIDEAPIGRRIEGSSGFAAQFSAQGPRDTKGRSLRQLDLERRLLRFPCSYMIYSEAFDALPSVAKDAVYGRMWQILSGRETDTRYARLSVVDRQAIVEILRDTKKGLPDYFQASTR